MQKRRGAEDWDIPMGNKKTVAATGAPVRFSMTAEPPVKSMAVTGWSTGKFLCKRL